MEDERIQREENSVLSINEPSLGYTHVLCCPCCPFFTLSSVNLNNHAISHGNENLSSYRTYTCSKCLSVSTERELMIEHVNIYHRNTMNPVELTEVIHTIVRQMESEKKKNDSGRITKRKRSHPRVERNIKKMRWRSRIKRIKNFSTRRGLSKRMLQDNDTFDITPGSYKYCTKEQEFPPDEPIDMSVKAQPKAESQVTNSSYDDTPITADYPSLYSNIKCHLLDMFTKSPITANISNPLLMRYISSHMHSIGANKYFNGDHYQQRNLSLPGNRISTTNDTLYQAHNQMSMSKLQSVNSSSCGTPHRSLHRNNFTPFQNHILLEWYDKHKNKPYPSTDDTKHLSALCGLSYPQVKKWFANKRARSTFYQKNDLISCEDEIRCDMMRFPLRVAGRLNADIARSMEIQFLKSMETKMPSGSIGLPGI